MGPARVGSSRVKSHKSERVGLKFLVLAGAGAPRRARRVGRVRVLAGPDTPRATEGRVGVARAEHGLWPCMFDVVTMTAYLLSYVLRSNQGALVTGLRSSLKDLPQ